MAWYEREYNRQSDYGPPGTGGGFLHGLWTFLNASVPLGTYFGIRVRLHITFLLLAGFQILQAVLISSTVLLWTLRVMALLFVSVLLHEFGHCFACRSVRGEANDILMWPLGGLASCAPPRRPWPEFVTVAGGPLVTLLLTVVPYAALHYGVRATVAAGLDPIAIWLSGPQGGLAGLLFDVYRVNYALLLFNLLMVFYPFDGGRLVQIALWAMVGYVKSMRWATSIGMAGAGAVAAYGIWIGQGMLVFIAVFGFITCYRQSQYLATAGVEPLYDPGHYTRARSSRSGWLARWRLRRAARRRDQAERELSRLDAEVDRILAKVKHGGLHSLTEGEKRTLQRATERQREAG